MRRFLAGLAISLLAVAGAGGPATAQEQRRGDDNAAIAVNTEDGATVFRLALSVRKVVNGVVDQTNTAVALASCTDCQTIALAFQVVLVRGDADVVVPVNQAVAFNDQCVECVTYASATQIVLGFDGNVRLTGEGRRRLAALYRDLRGLEDTAPSMSVVELNAAVQAAKVELVDILNTQLVERGRGDEVPPDDTTTTSRSATDSTGSTTTTSSPGEEPSSSTTSTTTTTSTSETSTTETTAPTTTQPTSETTTTSAP